MERASRSPLCSQPEEEEDEEEEGGEEGGAARGGAAAYEAALAELDERLNGWHGAGLRLLARGQAALVTVAGAAGGKGLGGGCCGGWRGRAGSEPRLRRRAGAGPCSETRAREAAGE